ncbi:hypothetical protein K491DRAFT_303273 [Lophiostoma macrostomum CBS 122681]|uniref:Altered inheritance of mitochondria protein 21 n=1 Tax=Lophiostoma macrostomum CBS 122681 TaxID=1314788 RepID=A0A6A6TDE9_9PLEO|nr:hypothetical protein K491DRAFT_303273 [Lophiostoma macrostomum CBS 122681]
MAAPTIPPRPSRAQNAQPSSSSGSMDVPKIPPRPSRGGNRSVSPNREAFTRSPLNDPSFVYNKPHKESRLNVEAPERPPSVTLPSIGQEGNEYAGYEELSRPPTREERHPQQTKSVAGDLPLHAPTASVPSSTAKNRIQAVTRTDSSQAAAAGIGSLAPESSHGVDSGRSDSSVGRSRPSSMMNDGEEQGIPEIGVQVPMYPNAGDVQAPTPSPYDQGGSAGVGFFNKGGQPGGRHHSRTKSGREIFHGPPGSYGLHGHGVIPKNEFEQKWYEKHPEDFKREKAGEYGPHIQENRKDYHWVGDDLVKLVHSSGKGIGLGTSREAIGTPDEQIGYRASEEYASRMASPRPASGRPGSISGKSGLQTESPLRQTNFPADQLTRQQTQDEEEEEDVIHIDPPAHPSSKYSGGGYDPPTEDLGPDGGNTKEEGGFVTERGYGIPILASDEIKRHPSNEWRQPAVSPELERRGSGEFTLNDSDGQPAYVTKQRTHSRSSSRNSGVRLGRVTSPNDYDRSTPLESHKEYEPLFPDEEDQPKKPQSVADKLKRPDLARHHFPSQDVWEDTPNSLQLQTTVETPQAPEEVENPVDADASQVFEKPENEEKRKDNITEEDQQSFLPEHTKRFANKHLNKEHLSAPTRPGMQNRFPSEDIWEDAPSHGYLETTVSGPQSEETNEYADDSPVAEKQKPSIPARPQKAKETSPIDKKAPIIPERPKPQVPVRPAKPLTKSSDKVPTLEDQGSGAEAPQPKAKPPVPARPGGSKIAALQAGFLKDLNSKLGLGPQAPKVKEPEPEKEEEAPKPLQDARKGRAKGPQRRKPTSSPSPAAAATVTAEVAVPRVKFELAPVTAIWSIGEDGAVDVPAAKIAAKIHEALKVPEKSETAQAVPEKVEKPEVEKEAPEKADIAESEEAGLEKTLTAESNKSSRAERAEEFDEPDLDAQGGVSLDNKVSAEVPAAEPAPEGLAAPEQVEAPYGGQEEALRDNVAGQGTGVRDNVA